MSDNPIYDTLTGALDAGPLPPGAALTPARHADPDGPTRGWSAADVTPGEYTSDDYAAGFPTLVHRTTDPGADPGEEAPGGTE